ncbi:MAG: transcription-repair coupling factor [Acidobacteriota bacterium]|nr:transcription-repair coupling factor [Acidobacteriota bacterium]
MVQPFVRELFADVEKSDTFRRALLPLKRGTSASAFGAGGQKAGAGRIRVSGLTPTAKALHLPLLHRAAQRPLLIIVRDNRAADALLPVLRAACELTMAADPAAVIALPAFDTLPFENQSPHPEIQEERAAALWKIATGGAEIVIAPIESALMRMRVAEHYSGLARTLRKGETIDSERLVEHLNLVGYVKVDVVEMPGQYAVRGGILDVYSPEMDRPARAEFFGDEIESLRKFDPASQRSQNPLDEAVLLPLTETAVSEATLAAIHTRLSGQRIIGAQAVVEDAIVAGGVSVFPGWELYAPVAGANSTLLDLLPEAAVFVDEPTEVAPELEAFWEKLEAVHEQSGVGKLVRPAELFLSSDEWQAALAQRPGGSLEHLAIETSGSETITFQSQPTPKFHGAVPALVEEVQRLTADGRRVLFCAGSTGEMERLADIFTEYNVPFRMGMRTGTAGGETFLDEAAYFTEDVFATTLVRAYVPDGVLLPEVKLAVFGSRDLFDESESAISRPIKQKSKTATFMSDFRDLAVGDYVVHVEHGIGEYRGLREIDQDGAPAEFMVLEYAEAAKLYVPLTRLDLIQKYRSAEGAKPVLSRLGTAAWQKTKTRVKKAMKEMADELLKLYAARKTAAGHAFPADTDWQREFEDAFEFQETEDQAQAVVDIKRDMQSPQPMDRLLCGDVGYGKTEVAMRAAFKAVSDGKQAAVLAPTTILAFQHFETFKERFKQFPITIEMISRFRSAKQQKEIVEKVEQGKVDILIGTHRLLSQDIKFQDLGLLVVDEEQRFGVRHKERLKQMKREVDVLTMSATPIPRTLHMAVVGLRDMSVIETPPKDRMAIQTVVAAFDEKLIRSSIEQELERGGQVYFVHNRVESIYEIAAKIQELVPRARVLVGHGQMSERELEKVMFGFVRHNADVLVATTIIENGLDIPLCNTILINRADRHGLSELYQLRGRVGRSNQRAYAYLLVPPEQELTAIARRRLAALKEFSDLGAGFKIAALDLELRGAGNLLGGEQSGHIDAVGFELYTSMLERTIKELRGEVSEEQAETQLNLGLNIRISPEYIAEENQRLRMYKRVAAVESLQQLGDVRDELTDRYGEPPAAVRNLLEYAELKLAAERVGVAGIDRRREVVHVKFTEKAIVDPEKLAQFVAKERGAQFTPAGVLRFQLKSTRPEDVLARLKELLADLAAEEVGVA